MKNLIFLIFLFANLCNIKAQDTIYRKDSSIQIGKIIVITDNQIKYKKDNNPDSPRFVISKEDIFKISYENGNIDNFNFKPTYNTTIAIDSIKYNFGRNFISINLFDFANGLLTISYERTFKSGDFSIKIPLSIGLNTLKSSDSLPLYYDEEKLYYNRNKLFSTGIDFYAYPYGQGKTRYFMGVSFEYGMINSIWDNSMQHIVENQRIKNFYSFLFQNGFLFQPTKSCNISINIGLGYGNSIRYQDFVDKLIIRGEVNSAYKFLYILS